MYYFQGIFYALKQVEAIEPVMGVTVKDIHQMKMGPIKVSIEAHFGKIYLYSSWLS